MGSAQHVVTSASSPRVLYSRMTSQCDIAVQGTDTPSSSKDTGWISALSQRDIREQNIMDYDTNCPAISTQTHVPY